MKTNDEIGMLANEFNQMAVKLAELDQAKDEFVNAKNYFIQDALECLQKSRNIKLEGKT